MKTSLTLVATALFSVLAAAAPITDNFGDVLVRSDENPESREIGNVSAENVLFKREFDFKIQRKQLAQRVKSAIDSRKGWLRNSFDAGLWETARKSYEEDLMAFEKQAEYMAGDNFNIESSLKALKGLLTSMTETGNKIRSFESCTYRGQDLMTEMMALSVEVLAFIDINGNVDVSDANVASTFEDKKLKFLDLQEKAKNDVSMLHGIRRIFDEYAKKAKEVFDTLLDVEDQAGTCPSL
ncbi:hypothetical protein OY671_002436 [Metschnikowia pulcherrima]|nr:hypothetical protein OY671_002436 [Metschnikowia pulcherrima]